jgi:hypothetical protein
MLRERPFQKDTLTERYPVDVLCVTAATPCTGPRRFADPPVGTLQRQHQEAVDASVTCQGITFFCTRGTLPVDDGERSKSENEQAGEASLEALRAIHPQASAPIEGASHGNLALPTISSAITGAQCNFVSSCRTRLRSHVFQ